MVGNLGMMDQLKGFFIKHYKMNFLTINDRTANVTKILCLITIIAAFSAFRLITLQDRINTEKSLLGILRSDSLNANSYALSKALSDVEMIGLASCITLTENTPITRLYYNTSQNSNCFSSSIGKKLFETRSQVSAINGLNYIVTFQSNFSWSFFFLEVFSYILIIISFFVFLQSRQKEMLNQKIKLTASELEKEMVLEKAHQIKHDIASPLTALRTIVFALNNIDPEIKDFLNRTVSRTEDIFKQLNQPTSSKQIDLSFFELNICIKEIIKEKEILWKNANIITFSIENNADLQALGNEIEMKRILSNLIQNSYDSLTEHNKECILISVQKIDEKIKIMIRDCGSGISAESITKLGTRGFTIGKEKNSTPGQGLGVYHAVTTLRDWGGSLSYESQVGVGTTATIFLRADKFH